MLLYGGENSMIEKKVGGMIERKKSTFLIIIYYPVISVAMP